MTDRKLVLLLFFVLALVLNALTVSVPGSRQNATLITVSENVSPARLLLKQDTFVTEFFEGEATVEFPVIVRKVSQFYARLTGISYRKSVTHPIKGQGPPAV